MYVQYREKKSYASERRWYRRLDGRFMPTWAMVLLRKFVNKFRSGDGVYLVEDTGFVMKVSDNDNGVYDRQYDNLRSLDRFGYVSRKEVQQRERQNRRHSYYR